MASVSTVKEVPADQYQPLSAVSTLTRLHTADVVERAVATASRYRGGSFADQVVYAALDDGGPAAGDDLVRFVVPSLPASLAALSVGRLAGIAASLGITGRSGAQKTTLVAEIEARVVVLERHNDLVDRVVAARRARLE